MRRTTDRWGWQRWSLRTKTVVATAVPMALIVLAVPLMFLAQRQATRVGADVEQAYRTRQQLAQLLQGLVDGETGVRGYLLTGDIEFLQTSQAGVASIPHTMRGLEQLVADGSDIATARFAELRRLAEDRVEVIVATQVFASQTPSGTIPEQMIARGHEIMDDIRALIAQMDTAETTRLTDARERLGEAERITFALSVMIVPLAMLLAILIALRHTSGLVRGIRRVEENARRLERGEPLLEPPHGDDELARLGEVLDETATRLAAQDAELRELALVDDLTGLPNRRAFLQIAHHELELAKRRSSVTALLFADADGLKHVNDEHGHAVGDEMLREIADVLREELRSADLVSRIGGDEFVVLLSRDSAMDGSDILDRLDRAIARRNEEPDRGYRLDVSVGVSLFDPLEPVGIEELITRADIDMYQQKRAKRMLQGETAGIASPHPRGPERAGSPT